MFEQITILGPGLLGASIAMAVKERRLAQRVIVWAHRPETRMKSAAQPWCDAVAETPEEAVIESDLVVVCTPVEAIFPLLEQIQDTLAPSALVTDVGSTKNHLCHQAETLLNKKATFVSSHPMTGSEQGGMDHAKGDLFEKAPCILTPVDAETAPGLDRIGAFWEALGMTITVLSPKQHDEVVAHVSHLPHILAASLCNYLSGKHPTWGKLSGGGLRDSTRIASSDPSLWQQILEQNREEVLRAMDGFQKELQRFKSALQSSHRTETTRLLNSGKDYRDQLNS